MTGTKAAASAGKLSIPTETAPATTSSVTKFNASIAVGALSTSPTTITGSASPAVGSPAAARAANSPTITFLMVSSELAIDCVVNAET